MRTSQVIAVGALSALSAGAALAHHGWGSYASDKPTTLNGTIAESTYQNPHGTLKLNAEGKVWMVILAPPSRMELRGLPASMLAVGKTATVMGYPHRQETAELRAERITIDGKTVELR